MTGSFYRPGSVGQFRHVRSYAEDGRYDESGAMDFPNDTFSDWIVRLADHLKKKQLSRQLDKTFMPPDGGTTMIESQLFRALGTLRVNRISGRTSVLPFVYLKLSEKEVTELILPARLFHFTGMCTFL